MHPVRPLCPGLLLCLLLPWGLSCGDGGAGSSTPAAMAEVSLVRLTPEPTYAGVTVELQAQITPKEGTASDALSWAIDWGDGSDMTLGSDITTVSATHAWELSGEFTVEVSARSGTRAVAQASKTVRILAPTDIALGDVTIRPANVQTGDTLTITAELKNLRPDDIPGPLELSAYLSTDPAPPTTTDTLRLLAQTRLESTDPTDPTILEAGATREFSLTQTIPEGIESGEYTVVVEVDSGKKINDDDRTNNIALARTKLRITGLDQLEPDLALETLLVSPDRAFPELNSLTRQVDLKNLGRLDAFGAVLETYLSLGDATLDETDRLIHTSEAIDLVAARSSADLVPVAIVLDQAIVPPPGQEVRVWVIVKVVGEGGAETNLVNNVLATQDPILVTDQPVQGPDVAVKSFSITPNQTFLQGNLEARLELVNEGTDDVGPFLCRIYISPSPTIDTVRDRAAESLNIQGLKSTERVIFERNILISALFEPGTFYFYVVCDPSDTLKEPFRSNNQSLYPTPILITNQSDVDLYGQSIEVPQQAVEGEDVTIKAQVCARGTNASGPFKVGLFRSPGFAVNYLGSEPVATAEVMNLGPGECEDLEFLLPTSCELFEQRYAYGVFADIDDVLVETNELNNTRSGDNLLLLSGTFCACTKDMFEPNNQSADASPLPQGLTQSLSICDRNTCDYYRTPTLLPGQSLIVKTRFEGARGPLVTTLFDSTGLQVRDVDERPVDRQEVAQFLSSGGDAVLKVCGIDPFVRNLYELEVEVLDQSPTFDLAVQDVAIPPLSVFSLGARVPVDFKVYNLGLQALPAGFDAEVRISADPTIDANDQLLGTLSLPALAASKESLQRLEVQLPSLLTEGTYFLGVTLDPGQSLPGEADTTNNVAISRPFKVTTTCFDPLEPNDSFDETYDLTATASFNNLVACAGKKDVYKLCTPGDKTFTFSASFMNAQGDLDLFLFDGQRKKIGSSATFNDTESVTVPYVNGPQCYYISVELISPGVMETTYSLDFTFKDVDPALRCASLGEPNDDFLTASSLITASALQSLDRCPQADADYYYLDVLAPNDLVTITATKDPAIQPGNIQLQLYNPNQLASTSAATAPDKPSAELKFFAASPGRHWIKVTADGNARNFTYTLAYTGATGLDLSVQNAQVGPGIYRSMDEVRLGFDLQNMGTQPTMAAVDYTVSFGTSPLPDPLTDTLLVSLTTPGPLAAGATLALFERFFLPAIAQPGTAYLHVRTTVAGDLNPANDVASVALQVAP